MGFFFIITAMKKLLFTLLPKNLLSQAFGFLASINLPIWSTLFKTVFYKIFKLNLEESEKSLGEYPNLQAMFTRRLKPGAREIAFDEVVSPVDGVLSQCGYIDDEDLQLIQAKNKTYTLAALLGSEKEAERYKGGMWATIYLSPYNYHRIHSGVSGDLVSALYVPGTLWPVNEWSVANIDEVFCVNERVTSIIQSGEKRSALCKVGATNVGKITLAYTDDIVCNTNKMDQFKDTLEWVPNHKVQIEKAAELGCFELGSTVVFVLDSKYRTQYPDLFSKYLNKSVTMGQSLS